MLETPRWQALGACTTQEDPDAQFVLGSEQNRAKAVCTGCRVRTECLAYALDRRIEFGVWGGMSERERRALLRRRPTVTSWSLLLAAARAEHARGALSRSSQHEDALVSHNSAESPSRENPGRCG